MPAPTPRPALPTDVSERVTVTGVRPAVTPLVSVNKEPNFLERFGTGADHASRFLEGQKGWVGQVEESAKKRGVENLDNFARVGNGLKGAGAGFSIAGELLGAAGEYKDGAPLKDVVPGTIMRGGAGAAAGLLGGALLSPLGPLGMAAGGILGSYLADKYLPERKILGERFNKAMEESAERPYYHGPS